MRNATKLHGLQSRINIKSIHANTQTLHPDETAILLFNHRTEEHQQLSQHITLQERQHGLSPGAQGGR
jgi:hypothetical protein